MAMCSGESCQKAFLINGKHEPVQHKIIRSNPKPQTSLESVTARQTEMKLSCRDHVNGMQRDQPGEKGSVGHVIGGKCMLAVAKGGKE